MVIAILLRYMLPGLNGYCNINKIWKRIFVVAIAILRRSMKKFIGSKRNKHAVGKHCHSEYSKSNTAWVIVDHENNFTGKF